MGKKESNRDIRKKVFRYTPEDYASVNYQQIKKIATEIALKELNKQCSVLMDICMMAYMDVMSDIREQPMTCMYFTSSRPSSVSGALAMTQGELSI